MNLRDILFRNISQITPPAFGLDISDLSLKIVFLKRHGKEIKLESFGRKEIPKGIIKEGKIQKKDDLIKIIKGGVKEVKSRKLKTKYVVCSLPEQHAFVQVIQLPKMKLTEVKEAVKWEAEANIPMSIEEVYLDWEIVEPIVNHLDHLDILINAVPKTLVSDYVEVLKKANLQPIALEVESLGTVRSLIKDGIARKPILIVDLGATRTSFIIFSGYATRFTTSASISNRQMIDAIAKSLGMTNEEAWRLKVRVGLSEKRDNKVLTILLPSLNDLVQRIKEYIVFHREHAAPHEHGSGGEISKILLCGGGANLKGLPQFLSKRLNISVVCGNPWVNILKLPIKSIPKLSYQESLTYVTALGLALRDISYRK
jgi:type IV pilus assembly protein PilM